MADPVFFGDRVWTPATIGEAIGEDEDWARYEIVDGVLIVSPHAGFRHQLVSARLVEAINRGLPREAVAVGPMSVTLRRSYRVTDATVLRASLEPDTASLEPADVLIAIEIESPSSVTTDRVTKPWEYARNGIPYYWRVEPDPIRLTAYRLVGDVYEAIGSWGGDESVDLVEPFELTFDLAALLG